MIQLKYRQRDIPTRREIVTSMPMQVYGRRGRLVRLRDGAGKPRQKGRGRAGRELCAWDQSPSWMRGEGLMLMGNDSLEVEDSHTVVADAAVGDEMSHEPTHGHFIFICWLVWCANTLTSQIEHSRLAVILSVKRDRCESGKRKHTAKCKSPRCKRSTRCSVLQSV